MLKSDGSLRMRVEPRWRIEMIGGLRAVRGETVLTRFRTQNSALLLAHLALACAGGPRRQRSLLRDELANQLWPESELRAGPAAGGYRPTGRGAAPVRGTGAAAGA